MLANSNHKLRVKNSNKLACDSFICVEKIKNNYSCTLFTLFNAFLIALLNSCNVVNSFTKIKKLNWTLGIKLDSN